MLKLGWIMALSLAMGCSSAKPGQIPAIGNKIPQSARVVLEGADSLEIMALHPSPYMEEGQPTPGKDDFRGYKILGSAQVTLPSNRDGILSAVYRGILASDGMVAACFNPRHGIRATKGKETVDLVICYECLSMHIHDSNGTRTTALTTSSPGARLTTIWQTNGLQVHAGGH